MSRRKNRKRPPPKGLADGSSVQVVRKPGRISVSHSLWFGSCVACLVMAVVAWLLARQHAENKTTFSGSAPAESLDAPYAPRPAGTITFNTEIAPIIFNRCAPCHHAGQPAPFQLLTYDDVAKRAKQISEVTQSNYMPPWLPEPGFGQFANERRLTEIERGLIQQWAREGAPEGNSKALPAPQFPEGWVLGRPDMVVTMPEEYVLGADGSDVYRNFVVPVPGAENRFVRALEFSPGNPKIVHHAFIKVDQHRASRILDARDAEVGFPGMAVPAEMPNGQFLTWQPGKLPAIAPAGLTWLLPAGSDLILQLHMNRSGKLERLRPSIGLYFTNAPPTRRCVKTTLTSMALDIPAGQSNYVVTDALTLPVDVEVLSILPHAHYLASEIQCFALLQDGTKKWLLLIKHWNFKWQGDYQFAQPVR